MASIEKRGRTYRIVFRFAGDKFSRSLKTTSERAERRSVGCICWLACRGNIPPSDYVPVGSPKGRWFDYPHLH